MPLDFKKLIPTNPAEPRINASAVTPNDTTDLSRPSILYVGTAGALKVDTLGGSTVTFGSVEPGPLPLWVTRVYATGTTASNIVAIW